VSPADQREVFDFDAAETFIKIARDAHAAGNMTDLIAARRLIAVALNMIEEPGFRIHTGHLR
jgi:hypothetical protein